MKIIRTEIYKFSIPMVPFTIATGTMHYAQNIYIRLVTDSGPDGVGECSAFPMIAGETQATCYEMAKDFARLWNGKDPLDIPARMAELHDFTAFAATAKSAFDMALFDLSAKNAGLPLYRFLGAENKLLETDLTIGIDTPEAMAVKARAFQADGVRIIKVKLGKEPSQDIERIRFIRAAVGPGIRLRVDANQGWDFEAAVEVLQAIEPYAIDFCEQPMRAWNDGKMPALRAVSPIKLMADESVFDHRDAERLLEAKACDYINIKLAKSGGILEAQQIADTCSRYDVACMMGGMLESRVALTAFGHFALSRPNIIFYDMDTCLLGHKLDPVRDGVQYENFFLRIPELPGIGASADPAFLAQCEQTTI